MILHHISDDTKLVKVTTTPHRPKWLLEGDGDRRDVISVPQGLEDRVGKSKKKETVYMEDGDVVLTSIEKENCM